MNFQINKLVLIMGLCFMAACTKQKIGPLSDIRPAVPVTVQNATEFRPDPTVTTSLSGTGAITITLAIPSTSGRTIKEVTRVIGSNTYTAIQGTAASYTTATAPVISGTTVTFTTSLNEYFLNYPVSGSNPAAKANTELAKRFYFMLTLDDGTVLYTTPVRVLVLS